MTDDRTTTITFTGPANLVAHIETLQATLTKRNALIEQLEKQLVEARDGHADPRALRKAYARGWNDCHEQLAAPLRDITAAVRRAEGVQHASASAAEEYAREDHRFEYRICLAGRADGQITGLESHATERALWDGYNSYAPQDLDTILAYRRAADTAEEWERIYPPYIVDTPDHPDAPGSFFAAMTEDEAIQQRDIFEEDSGIETIIRQRLGEGYTVVEP